VGAWGTGIFANDTACDVRDEYRFWLEEKLPDHEATQRVIATHDGDDDPDVWLALAATQWKLGRLEPEIKQRALQVIDEGQGLDLWEPDQVGRRKKALSALRAQLEQLPPPRREIRPKWAHVTDLNLGDVIAAPLDDKNAVALRVIWVYDEQRRWRTPAFEIYRWTGSQLPSVDDLKALNAETKHNGRFIHHVTISKLRRRDMDWREAGFRLIGNWPVRNPEAPPVTTGFVWDVAIDHFQ